LLRIILIIMAALLLYRLLSSLFRGVEKKPTPQQRKKRPGKEVGQGWIVEDEIDEEDKKK
jgi:hypothetical protein